MHPVHKETVIGLDLGTSMLKGVLADLSGEVLRTAEIPAQYARPRPGWVEADAGAHWRDVAGLIRALAAQAPGPVGALAISGASGNTLLTDASGVPLTPILNWMDTRCVSRPPRTLQGWTTAEVRTVSGWPCIHMFPLAHLAWLRENQPDAWERASHAGMNTDGLLFTLTGRWAMDHSTATTFHLQDQVRRRWHPPFLERLGLREEQLSRLVPSGTTVGTLTSKAAEACGLTSATRAVTGCFDHPSAARAVGVVEPGRLMLSCGTSWVGFFPEYDRQRLLDAELLCDPFLREEGGPWGGMFSVPSIGPAIHWYIENLIAPGAAEDERVKVFDERAARAPTGAGGLTIDLLVRPQPVDAPPALIARAVMEGAARALNTQLERLKARGFAFTRAVMVGGPSRSPVWPGILSSITGLDLEVGAAHAGAQGAAMLAAQGAGRMDFRLLGRPR